MQLSLTLASILNIMLILGFPRRVKFNNVGFLMRGLKDDGDPPWGLNLACNLSAPK